MKALHFLLISLVVNFVINFSIHSYAVEYEPNAPRDFPEKYQQFHNINLIAQSIFSAQMPKGIKLEILETFEINAPIASANFSKNVFSISILGGFARGAQALPGSQLLVLCHELGHLLAGYPQKISPEGELRWSSAEGQADYFSGGKCLFSLMANPYIYSIVKPYENNYIKYCSQFFQGRDKGQCSIALTLAENYSDIIDSPYEYTPSGISIYAKDESQVESTLRGNREYPSTQCRLDTIKAGIFKALSSQDNQIDNELTKRPRCWFKD
jgi:hypothetical protein